MKYKRNNTYLTGIIRPVSKRKCVHIAVGGSVTPPKRFLIESVFIMVGFKRLSVAYLRVLSATNEHSTSYLPKLCTF